MSKSVSNHLPPYYQVSGGPQRYESPAAIADDVTAGRVLPDDRGLLAVAKFQDPGADDLARAKELQAAARKSSGSAVNARRMVSLGTFGILVTGAAAICGAAPWMAPVVAVGLTALAGARAHSQAKVALHASEDAIALTTPTALEHGELRQEPATGTFSYTVRPQQATPRRENRLLSSLRDFCGEYAQGG